MDSSQGFPPGWHAARATWKRDGESLTALRLDAEKRLADMGIRQWYDTEGGLAVIRAYTDAGDMYIIRDGPRSIGCFALSERYDEDWWGDDPDRDNCLYLGKAITASYMKNRGVGRFTVDYATRVTRAAGLRAVRIDCWRERPGLQAAWHRLGFSYLRTILALDKRPGYEGKLRESGDLMELRVD